MNILLLTGFVGRDPECVKSKTGQTVLRFSLATRRPSGEDVDWHRCVLYGAYADKLAPKIRKGTHLAINGRIKYSEAVLNGAKCYFTDIIVNSVEVLQKHESSTTTDSEGDVVSKDGSFF